MIFPITDLLDDAQSEKWLLEHFHPEGYDAPSVLDEASLLPGDPDEHTHRLPLPRVV